MIDGSAIFRLLTTGDPGAVARLLEQQPDLVGARNENGDTPLRAAVYLGRSDLFDLLIAKGADVGVFEASAMGRLEAVRLCLDADPALVNAYSDDGWTPLHLASYFGHHEIVRLLLDRGAAIDARSRSTRFARENTPLHAAAANRRTRVVEILLERGADVNARDGSGYTPLALAANGKDDLLVVMLLEKGGRVI